MVNSGPCVVACGGPGNLICPAGQVCQLKDGDCGASGTPGTCAPRPVTCATAPPVAVCGCDGKTYASRCNAELSGAAGVNVAVAAACTCGGPNNVKCEAGKFCNFAVGTCAGANPTGTCTVPPKTCQPVASPVCGCDGKGYDNACHAAQAQVGLFSLTACPCGGPSNTPCAADQFCDYATTGTCLKPNAVGACGPKPTACPGVGPTVCGCDGVQYLNDCEAARQGGTSVASGGACNFGDAGIADAATGG